MDTQPKPTPMFGINKLMVKGTLSVDSPVSAPGCKFTGNCSIGAFTYIGAGSAAFIAKIGRYCSIGTKVTLGMPSHNTDALSTHPFASGHNGAFLKSVEFQRIKGEAIQNKNDGIVVGNDVWVGGNVMIRGGVSIGDGAVIGAGAVVVKDVAPYEVVGGVSAKHIRFRFSEDLRSRLLSLQWWKYDLSPLGPGFNYSNMQVVLDKLEKAVSEGLLSPLVPLTKTYRPVVK